MKIADIEGLDVAPELRSRDMAIEIESILPALAENLYGSDWRVSLRELLQNAQDALTQRQHLESVGTITAQQWRPRIDVWIDRSAKLDALVIQDNGVGLTEQEIHDYIATIGRTGKSIADKALAERKDLIGQFGIGFLSSFIIGRKVIVVSQSARQPKAPTAAASFVGHTKYLVGELAEPAAVGTTIRVELKKEFSNPGRAEFNLLDFQKIETAIRTCADNLPAPIYLHQDRSDETGVLVNAQVPPWDREDVSIVGLRRYLEARAEPFGDIAHIAPFRFTSPANGVDAAGIVYFAKSETGYRMVDGQYPGILFVRRMQVPTGWQRLLPPWFRFAGVIVECPDLTLNLSRDRVFDQLDPFRDLQTTLSAFIVNACDEWTSESGFLSCYRENIRRFTESLIASNNRDPDKALFRVLVPAIPFHVRSSRMAKGKEMSLAEYVECAFQEQDALREYPEAHLPNTDGASVSGEGPYLYLMTQKDQGRLRAMAVGQSYPVIYVASDTERDTLLAYSREIKARAFDVADLWHVAPIRLGDQREFEGLRSLCLEADSRLGISEVKVGHFKPGCIPALLVSAGADRQEADLIDQFLSKGENILSGSLARYLRSQSEWIRLGKVKFTLYLNASNDVIIKLAERLEKQPETRRAVHDIVNEIVLSAALPLFDDPSLTEQLMGLRAKNVIAHLGVEAELARARREVSVLETNRERGLLSAAETFRKEIASLETEVKRRLPPEDALNLAGVPSEATRRDCAVVILDLVKSTWLLGNVDIKEGGEIFEEFVAMISSRVRSQGGHFDKFTGDGVLAEFFVEDDGEDGRRSAARRAFECARTVIGDIESLFAKEPWRDLLHDASLEGPKTRTAISWGPVNFGRYSGAGTAVGAPMVQVARLCNEKRFFLQSETKPEYRIIGSASIFEYIGLGAAVAADRLIERNWKIEGLAPVTVFGLYP